ncbi:MAG: flavodoxin family protein [Nanoarchaeota archaeon]|nr:flavodoxin family protein [Nanoarchaeota archaeon]
MKVIAICGSPRKGNTEQMLQWVLDSCRAGGAEVEMVLLKDLKIQHCTGCDMCYGAGRPCVIDDDMESVISKMLEADAIVFGSPNYFFNVSGMMKDFIDRTNCICDPYLLKGKVSACVAVGARDVNETCLVESVFKKYIGVMGMVCVGSVIGKAEDPGEITKNEDVKLACTELGNRILDKLRH